MHHYTPTVIIYSVTRDRSFQLGWNFGGGEAQKGQAAIAGSSAPQGKRVRGVHDNAFIASEW